MMFNIKKYKIQKVVPAVKKIPRYVANHFFYAVFVVLIIVFFLGGLVYYRYSFLVDRGKIADSSNVSDFKEEIYQKILAVWSVREKKFIESENKIYSNPFQPVLQELTK